MAIVPCPGTRITNAKDRLVMADYSIREATLDDAQALIDYLVELSQEPDITLPMSPGSVNLTIEQEHAYLTGHLEPANATYFVAEADGQIIGTLHCTGIDLPIIEDMARHVADMGVSVREDWRGKGVGTALMNRGIAWARSTGTIERLQLEVFAHNEAAIHIYEKLGFEVEGRRRRAFKRDGAYIDSFTMALFLE
jgi:RimJ/RimL family protein N-acetyltransferase